MRGRSSTLLGFVLTAVVAVPSAAFVMQRTLERGPDHKMELMSATGAVSITNSLEGQAILTAAPMIPGTSVTGTVNLVNTGDAAERLTLDASDPVDHPGPGGGRLSERLRLRVEDVSTDGNPQTVFAGPLADLEQAGLGTLDEDERRTYRFVVTFPDGGADGADNAFQGSSASVDFEWIVDAAGPAEPPASAPLEQQVTSDAPAAYWPLDGSQSGMADAAGDHAGAYANDVAAAAGAAPGGGTAAWFDGVSAYAYVDQIAAPSQAYTMEAWVKPATNRDMAILEHGAGGALAISGGRFALRHLDTTVRSSVAPVTGRWHQVVGTWDAASGNARLYVDGALAAEKPVAGLPSGSATFFVGRDNAAGSFFHGAIAQVSYYPSSLTGARVSAHWAAGKVAGTEPPAPVDPQPPTPADPGPSTPTPPGDPAPAPADPAPVADPGTSTAPGASCPGTVSAQGGHSTMWSILNARAKARNAAKARAIAKAQARARAKSKSRAKVRGKVRAKVRAKPAAATKKTKRTACTGARATQRDRTG